MKTYQTISGHEIEYDAAPDVTKYLAKVQKAAAAGASEAELTALIYSPENPVMDSKMLPGRGMVTPAVLADPVYLVMTDILARKSMEVRGVDAGDLAKHFTMTAAEAAEQLGVSRTAIYKAIDTGRLGAWMINGQQMIDPRALASLDSKPRGPQPQGNRGRPLAVCYGTDGDGNWLRVTSTQIAVGEQNGHRRAGRIGANWKRVGVFTGTKDGNARFFVLEPADGENEIKLGDLYVRGRFAVLAKVNNPKKAEAALKEFQPA